jgi:hypothetical protein
MANGRSFISNVSLPINYFLAFPEWDIALMVCRLNYSRGGRPKKGSISTELSSRFPIGGGEGLLDPWPEIQSALNPDRGHASWLRGQILSP